MFKVGLVDNVNTDMVHAILRVGSITFMIGYVAVGLAVGFAGPETKWLFIPGALSLVFSIGFLVAVRMGDAGKGWRHWLVMAHDYAAITLAMVVGGAEESIFFTFAICAIVGHGLRYGVASLWGATIMAVTSIALTTLFNSYWRGNPFLGLTLGSTAILMPVYVHTLLKRLQEAYKAEREASLSKSRFLAQASHDLRQPIHAISLFTACLREAGLDSDEVKMVENIDRSLVSVSRLFKSLLDVSTLDSGKVIPNLEIVSIADVIDDVVRTNGELAQRAGCQLKVVQRSDHIRTDRGLLTTILQNLVSNAIKYAPGSAILIGCRRRGSSISIEVCDQGPGISEEHQKMIFDEFYQIRERGDRDVDGVGLGLPIVRRLAKLLRLDVSLHSVVHRGTRVQVKGLQIVDRPSRPTTRVAQVTPSVIAGLRILLVEDDHDVMVATASLLRKWGCDVQAELSIPTMTECDLLITDYDLGGKQTGTDCIERVRAQSGWPVPAIILTGHDVGRVREELPDQTVPVLSKPVRPTELRSVVVSMAMEAAEIAD